jgi:hypothetical protein
MLVVLSNTKGMSGSFSGTSQERTLRPFHTQITIEIHSKNPPHQSPQKQFSFLGHGKVPEGPLPSPFLLSCATCTTTLLTFPSAASYRTPFPKYLQSLLFPVMPLTCRAKDGDLLSPTSSATGRSSEFVGQISRQGGDCDRNRHTYITDHSRTLYSALPRELAARFSDSRALDSGRPRRAPLISGFPFRT